ncbi:high affinity cAMP-specific and IBMX-insensitive 3',5'-cyclic phosphodiesterase 8A-like [Falco naumanni]|uniref:high affinity cAMP-specific and IBMX-insensitive 3',5'-cyclic phosphodiesterase 8A-like n=1 Tax=Falco naumanni TaxID=148594 RepID=UPI001ADE368C|nr:high affinity cAMP-specific and IBMX-insensitive 3',5'-cyclic phosphodiesterase 8A-like [Falco naumanni]
MAALEDAAVPGLSLRLPPPRGRQGRSHGRLRFRSSRPGEGSTAPSPHRPPAPPPGRGFASFPPGARGALQQSSPHRGGSRGARLCRIPPRPGPSRRAWAPQAALPTGCPRGCERGQQRSLLLLLVVVFSEEISAPSPPAAQRTAHPLAASFQREVVLHWLTELEIFAMIFAAAIHDYEHTGTTNNFHIQTRSDSAILYNDWSVLENHHVSVVYRLLQDDEEMNILSNLSKDDWR